MKHHHLNSKLTVFLRQKMITDYLNGKKVAKIAEELGISRKCFYYWLNRYKKEGQKGLFNKSTKPVNSPTQISNYLEQRIIFLRKKKKIGPQRIAYELGVSSSTVYSALKRNSLNRLYPKVKKEVKRYEKSYPGELLHIDIKHIASVSSKGYKYQFSAVDDYSRQSFAKVYDKKTAKYAAFFLEEALSYFKFPVKAVMTDNELCFSMALAYNKGALTQFGKLLRQKGIAHKLIKPRRPETNGKVERFHRTIDEEAYKIKKFRSDEHREKELASYLKKYNGSRRHLGIGGLTPNQRVANYFLKEKCYQCV